MEVTRREDIKKATRDFQILAQEALHQHQQIIEKYNECRQNFEELQQKYRALAVFVEGQEALQKIHRGEGGSTIFFLTNMKLFQAEELVHRLLRITMPDYVSQLR